MKRKWKNLLKRAGIILLLSAVLTQTAGSYVYAETETDTAEHLYQEQEEITENTESQENTEDEKEFDEMDLSALKEIGNIIAASYLNALSVMTNLMITPSIPYIAVDMAASILSVPAISFGQFGDNALLIQTEFGDDVMISGYFILMPEQDSYEKLLKMTPKVGALVSTPEGRGIVQDANPLTGALKIALDKNHFFQMPRQPFPRCVQSLLVSIKGKPQHHGR